MGIAVQRICGALQHEVLGPTYYLLIHPINRLIQQRIVDFYLDHKAQPIAPVAVATLNPPYYIVAAHMEALVARLAANPTHSCPVSARRLCTALGIDRNVKAH